MRIFGLRVDLHPIALTPGLLAAAVTYMLSSKDPQRARNTLLSGILWYEAEANHVAGHALSAQMAGAPMDRIDWGVLPQTLYDDNDVTPQQHIGRAIGGPLASALSMLIWWSIWRVLQGKPIARVALIAMIHNMIITLGSWLPLPLVDGGVIYKNIRRL